MAPRSFSDSHQPLCATAVKNIPDGFRSPDTTAFASHGRLWHPATYSWWANLQRNAQVPLPGQVPSLLSGGRRRWRRVGLEVFDLLSRDLQHIVQKLIRERCSL